MNPYDVFLASDAAAINKARLEHLASLGIELSGKRVLEVGAGIGLHTPFFLSRGCDVLVTDGNVQNVAEVRRRLPGVKAAVLDLEKPQNISNLGTFDLVYCYGLLYHLSNPGGGIESLASVCSGQLLLETVVGLGRHEELQLVRDSVSNNQAIYGIGCRPTRLWVINAVRMYFGHCYVSRTQPDYPDFIADWLLPETRLLYRAVFVGSKTPLVLPDLVSELPDLQPVYKAP